MTSHVFRQPGASMIVHSDAPTYDGKRTCAISDMVFAAAQAGFDALSQVCNKMRADGYEAVIAPMNGDTWHSYRVITESDGSPPFLLEPKSGSFDLFCLEEAGFESVVEYSSARAPVAAPDAVDVHLDGITIEAWDGKNGEALIEQVYEASLASFANAAFFKPISKEDFLALYAPVVPMIDPRLVLFARDAEGKPVGFLFGMPDLCATEGERCAILKTYAGSKPGVGRALAQRFHIIARDLGYAGVIHALMREDNKSRGASVKHGGKVFRRYALMRKCF